MPPSPPSRDAVRLVPCPSAADVDAQIRALAAGRVVWTRSALCEWQRLTRVWADMQRDTVGEAA